jgi:hypothetical protein
MKYLKLFEAFESDAISKVMNFIAKEVNKGSARNFLTDLKRLIGRYDVPIDKISNDDITYLNTKAALKVKPKEVDNKWGLYAIKYWFSISNGYKGYSGIGNEEFNYNDYKNKKMNNKFTDREIAHIKNELGITKGKLVEIKKSEYEKLNHGDLVVANFDDYSSLDKIAIGKIFIEDDQLFAFQSVSAGGEPYNYRGFNRDEDGNVDPKFRYSWSLGHLNSPGSDHIKLHKYIETDEELTLEGDSYNKEVETESVYDFNLPFDGPYLTEWRNGHISEESIEDSDFCIILNIDNLIKKTKSVVKLKQDREESKKDALKLMSDNQIRNLNINRYFTEIVKKMVVDSNEVKDLRDLQKIIKKCLIGKWSLFSIYRDDPSMDHISYFSDYLKNFIGTNDKYYLDKLVNIFKDISKKNTNYTQDYIKSEQIFGKLKNSEQSKEFYNILLEIGQDIYNWASSKEIQTLGELKVMYYKINTIRNILHDDELRPRTSSDFIRYFIHTSDVEYYANILSNKDLTDDIKKLKILKDHIKTILT